VQGFCCRFDCYTIRVCCSDYSSNGCCSLLLVHAALHILRKCGICAVVCLLGCYVCPSSSSRPAVTHCCCRGLSGQYCYLLLHSGMSPVERCTMSVSVHSA
jgi:hypothetical protein